eukprot:6175500-Pleurochrysis_carterae.AAC.5
MIVGSRRYGRWSFGATKVRVVPIVRNEGTDDDDCAQRRDGCAKRARNGLAASPNERGAC